MPPSGRQMVSGYASKKCCSRSTIWYGTVQHGMVPVVWYSGVWRYPAIYHTIWIIPYPGTPTIPYQLGSILHVRPRGPKSIGTEPHDQSYCTQGWIL
eukprot:scaffold901_cov167-Amphora_coffeaeformis.AAC.17